MTGNSTPEAHMISEHATTLQASLLPIPTHTIHNNGLHSKGETLGRVSLSLWTVFPLRLAQPDHRTPPLPSRPFSGQYSLILTFVAFHGVDINRRIKLSRPKEARVVEEIARAVRGCAIGGNGVASETIVLTLFILCPILHFHLFLLRSVNIVDPNQQAVVHNLQLS